MEGKLIRRLPNEADSLTIVTSVKLIFIIYKNTY